jgi:membrane associated rhomboid family serine protease
VKDTTVYTNNTPTPQERSWLSYRTALTHYRQQPWLLRMPWITWIITIVTCLVWVFTSQQTAVALGLHGFSGWITFVVRDAISLSTRDNDALSQVLITYGAKDNTLILHGQYWRFVTPIFLHANALHIGLNMLNFVILGVVLERMLGAWRFLFIYLVTGIIASIASFHFSPQDISVGASGAIFGLVGAYSIFIVAHRRAFRFGGIPALGWLVLIIALNLGLGLFVQNVDNAAHVGGLLSGCVLGWWFAPLYKQIAQDRLIDVHSLGRRWHLALLTITGTLILAIIALHITNA